VTLHELGHSVVALKFGVPVREIILLPIGGVAMLRRIPRTPVKELAIAVAGPLVNVVIAIAIWLGLRVNVAMGRFNMDELVTAARSGPSAMLLLMWLLRANVALVLFNLIPAFPLDGGRIFRALLAIRMGHARATRVAAGVGQMLAVLLGMYGLMSGGVLMVFVAAFIFFAAAAEQNESRQRAVLAGQTVGDAYNRNAIVLSPNDRLSTVVRYILTGYQPDFAVTSAHELIGVVTRQDVIDALQRRVGDVPVSTMMQQHPLHLDASTSLDDALRKMSENNTRIAAVYDNEHFLGLISAEDIAEAFAVLQFMTPEHPGNAPGVAEPREVAA
jgi:Zn-dependent protease/predicted transcriptional regulator